MSYSRPPVQPGRGLKRSPSLPIESTAGVFDYALDADIATTTNLGVVQVGSGLVITPEGVLSTTSEDDNTFISIKLTSSNYNVTNKDSYIGATANNITITIPIGEFGRVYYVKNQSSGNIKVHASGTQTIDGQAFQTLGTNAGFMLVFDGTRWNII
ncbi:hypothetical protein UFOVP961_19 [uncultured Caudovirales phage]|uniref:Uncharacterized protein n=1 Tax=uncultured Caudovirales phage TaxID=2100421 RepID=A0A6J5QXV7_9CAUD|nr:hypothetical protein UFOVP961_19 [uncultured Caudovirales phage]CAB4185525.1 hypothetical protein UFOVP1123_89 [uncultured Caudovirales phage]CAB4193328.1 hypothetical protein UFOVP1239_61 [uncultured Caudovirales phage]CAB4216144.1 hypothetical protein UFOVP1484_93 [uncultured Caudovirales phage]CAB5230771.1 hypothetical protein UFOVP1577_99 [uncultured Caudovirales phage]